MLSVTNPEVLARVGPAEASADEPAQRSEAAAIDHPSVELALVTERSAFDALEADWNALFERAGRPSQVFQTFGWCWHWCNHFLGNATSLAVVTARRDDRLVMVWPMVLERSALVTQLRWLGEPVSQYGDLVIEDAPDARTIITAAWSHALAGLQPDLATLRKVREDAAIAPFLTSLAPLQLGHEEAPYIDLTSATDFEAFEQGLSSKARRNRRRLMRRLEDQGAVRFQTFRKGANAAAVAVRAIAMKRDWLAARNLLSQTLTDPRTERFFADAARAAEKLAGCQVSALTVAGTAAGAQVGIVAKRHLAMHIIVYNLAFEKFGVGCLHLEEAIRQGYRDGLERIDMLAPRADYKIEWADGSVGVVDHAVPLTLSGQVYARGYLALVRKRLAALIKTQPAPMIWLRQRGLLARVGR